jgi:anti-sigma regulatory factor (Ser/Thr protein kinase)
MSEEHYTCPPDLVGDRVVLTVPATPAYLDLVTQAAEAVAAHAGFGPHGAGRCRLLAEEIFHNVAAECGRVGRRDPCRLELAVTSDGLTMCFVTDHLNYDPEQDAGYSLGAVLEGEPQDGLGLHLVKHYAQGITLTRRGAARELCLVVPRGDLDEGARPWGRLTPRLALGVTLTPAERNGRLVYRLDDPGRGKSYLARALAHQVLGLIDGRRSFAAVMAQTLKVMPEAGRHGVEDLFEVLIQRGLVQVSQEARSGAKVEVREQVEVKTLHALQAYQKAGLGGLGKTKGGSGSAGGADGGN